MPRSKTQSPVTDSKVEDRDKKETVLLILLIVILALLGYLAMANFGTLYTVM